MTSAKTTKPTTTQQEPEVAVFIATDQQQSSFFREEDPEHDGAKTFLSACDRMIPNESEIVEVDPQTGNRVVRKTRYIKGCPTFYVDEQRRMGYQPNLQADVIWMEKGMLTVRNVEHGVYLLKYLREGCTPNLDCPNRIEGAPSIFKELNYVEESQNEEEVIDTLFKVQSYLNGLKKTLLDEVSYNGDALEFLCDMLGLSTFESGFASSEAWVAVYRKATNEPEAFMSKLNAAKAPIEQTVYQAVAGGVVQLDTEKAFLGDASGKLLLKFGRKVSEEQATSLLVDYFLNPSNRSIYGRVQELLAASIAGRQKVIS